MFDLSGKKAMITGASGGIGEDLAKVFHACGAEVLLHGTRAERLESLASELGERAHVMTADLSDPQAVGELAQKALEKMEEIHILVNNAGLTRDGLFVRMSPEDWDLVMQVNLTACFRLSRDLVYPMMRRKSGRIINITSVVATVGNPGQGNYCAAKAGMIGMSKSLAAEIASRGVTVNCIAPGFIKSPMTDALNESQHEAILANVPMKKLGEGADIAHCAAYLAADEAAYITGQTIHVNGGMVMV